MQSTEERRVRILVSGVVQGVGFRPYVYSLASRCELAGYVRNNSGIVEIEVQGRNPSIDAFVEQLEEQAPALASIKQVSTRPIEVDPNSMGKFRILESEKSSSNKQGFVPPDTATCRDCLSELFDPNDRRYRYPFINCTACGPRFTIISSLPYDRPGTTMASFRMCDLCQQEYDDPANRRFHAQPNACASCGPFLSFVDLNEPQLTSHKESALVVAMNQLRRGRIIALKGLGGFQLICDATDGNTIQELRRRKSRGAKPFALMMADLDMVRNYCCCSKEEIQELTGSARPIVLLNRLPESELPMEIAPGINRLGVMLPYTPLHHLLLAGLKRPLIATSANLSEEPIAKDNEESFERLKDIADGFLIHNRGIHVRYDDSVVQYLGGTATVLRRARGLAPLPINLPIEVKQTALACGAHLKNTFCLIQKDQAFVSQHIGDLENIETHQHFEQTLESYKQLFDIEPEMVAHDCHPDYLSTAFAERLSRDHVLPRFAVQHHHAHIVSCMVEHGLTEPVIGVAFDGLGYGLDGTLWGGEFLLASFKECTRLAYFQPVPIPGGSHGIKSPWRMALSYLVTDSGIDRTLFAGFIDSLRDRFGETPVNLVCKQVERKVNSPLTSSCGRLFDAMSALLGVCYEADYEGQAAMELEALARSGTFGDIDSSRSYSFELTGDRKLCEINVSNVLSSAYADFLRGTSAHEIATNFHYTVARIVLSVCSRLRNLTGVATICLGGGVFQNLLLLRLVNQLLIEADFKVFFPQQLPANDGGLSLGQAVIALARAGAIVNPGLRG
jgi:hydrogenase maturation protein HypF